MYYRSVSFHVSITILNPLKICRPMLTLYPRMSGPATKTFPLQQKYRRHCPVQWSLSDLWPFYKFSFNNCDYSSYTTHAISLTGLIGTWRTWAYYKDFRLNDFRLCYGPSMKKVFWRVNNFSVSSYTEAYTCYKIATTFRDPFVVFCGSVWPSFCPSQNLTGLLLNRNYRCNSNQTLQNDQYLV
jgi:hypothetical protein